MHPDLWSSVHHLLLCSFHSDGSIEYLANALKEIDPVLSQKSFQWLLLDSENHYHLISNFNSINCTKENLSTNLSTTDPHAIINVLQASSFDAAIILTLPGQSPYQLAYLCYLAGIPIRLGQSQEFGGGVLSHCIQPPLDPVPPTQYILHLLHSAGLQQFLVELAIVS
jgi:hypothetical protein